MKYDVFAIIICVVTWVGCSHKESVEKPVDGVYPHLLQAEMDFVQELDGLGQKYDVESVKEKVKIKERIFDLIVATIALIIFAIPMIIIAIVIRIDSK